MKKQTDETKDILSIALQQKFSPVNDTWKTSEDYKLDEILGKSITAEMKLYNNWLNECDMFLGKIEKHELNFDEANELIIAVDTIENHLMMLNEILHGERKITDTETLRTEHTAFRKKFADRKDIYGNALVKYAHFMTRLSGSYDDDDLEAVA